MLTAGGRLDAGLQSILETAFDAVVVMDLDGVVVGWNDRAAACFGWARDEVLGLRLSEAIIPPGQRSAHEQGLARYRSTRVSKMLNHRIEVAALHRDGHEFPIELSIAATEQSGDTMFVGFLRDISDRLEAEERQQRVLQESEHRVKNMLTVVAAIAQQTARNSANIDEFSEAFQGRLQSLAEAHQLLVGKVWNEIALSALVEQVLGDDVAVGRARFGGPEVLLQPRQVLGLSMVLHELHTNAVKYGGLSAEDGKVELDWSLEGNCVELVWSEHGAPAKSDAPGSGFGQRMIAMSVKADLEGTMERDWRPEGLKAILRFPLNP